MLHWKDKALQFQQQSLQLSPHAKLQSPVTQLFSHEESNLKCEQISSSSLEKELRAIQTQYSERLRSLFSQCIQQFNVGIQNIILQICMYTCKLYIYVHIYKI